MCVKIYLNLRVGKNNASRVSAFKDYTPVFPDFPLNLVKIFSDNLQLRQGGGKE